MSRLQTSVDIEMVKERYRRMSDAELKWAALHDAANLTPEAQEILRHEITTRNLDAAIHTAIEAQNTTWSEQEISAACSLLRALSCPCCGSNAQLLNAAVITRVTGVFVFSSMSRRLVVACPDCLSRLLTKASSSTLLFMLISNPIHTFRALISNTNMRSSIAQQAATIQMTDFTAANMGVIKAYENDHEKLNAVLREQ